LLVDRKVDKTKPILEKALKSNPNLYNVYNNLIIPYGSKRNICSFLYIGVLIAVGLYLRIVSKRVSQGDMVD
jgi:hypothetical protein